MPLLVLLTALTFVASDSGTRTSAEWAVAQAEPEPGDPFAAWLTIHAHSTGSATKAEVSGSGASTHRITVVLANTPDVTLWVRAPGSNCDSAPGQTDWSGVAKGDTVLAVCAEAVHRQDLRLVATVLDSTSAGVAASVASSEILHARQPWYDPGPTLSGVLTAVFGFLTGLGTSVFQHRWERRQAREEKKTAETTARAQHARAMELEVIHALGPEWVENKARLERFLASTTAPPEALHTAGYNALLGSPDGAVEYLGDSSRRHYFQRVNGIYQAISRYNDAFQDWQTSHDQANLVALRNDAADLLAKYRTITP